MQKKKKLKKENKSLTNISEYLQMSTIELQKFGPKKENLKLVKELNGNQYEPQKLK